MRKLKLLIAMSALLFGSVASWAQDAGTYYIQNVSNGKWLGPGNNWSTQASVLNHADYWKLAKINDGVYTLESVVSNGDPSYYLSGTYCDGGATNFTFTAVEGKEKTYTIASTGLLTTNGNTVDVSGSDATATASQWKLWSEADMAAGMAAATVANPFDATYLIKDHDLGRNNRDYSSWSNSGATEPKSTASGGAAVYSVEAYCKTFDVNQTLSGIPNGVYAVRVNGFYRQDGSNANLPYVYANDSKTTLPVRTGTENDMQSAAVSFVAGNYLSDPAYVQVTDGTLKVGVKTEGTSCWTIFKNFHLTYYGNVTVAEVLLADYVKAYNEALTEAQAFTEGSMFAEAWTALQSAISSNTLDLSNVTQEQLETATANLRAANTAATAAVKAKTCYDNAVALINGGTNVDLTSVVVNPSFENGNLNGWTSVNGGAPANNNNWSKVGTWYVERWTSNGDTQNHLSDGTLTHDALVLPAGLYTVTAKAQNQEQKNGVAGTGYFLYANDAKVEITGTNTYSTSVLLTEDKSELVIKFALESCTGNWVSCDNITLTYVGEDFPAYTLVEGKMNAEIADAQTAADNAFNASKTIENYNALIAAIAAAQASKDAYAAAATAIANAEDLQTKHNFASATAASTFANAIAAIKTPYENNTLTTDVANNAGASLGTVITGWHAGANSAAVAYLNDGFGLNDFDAALYINTWSNEGEEDGSNFKVPFYEYFAGEGNALGANTWTALLTGLENGLYRVSAWVRVRTLNEATAAADATGISMNVNGGTTVDVTEGDPIEGTTRFQLKEYTAEGLVKDGNLHFNMVIDAENNIHWLSFKNIKYTKVRDLYPDEEAVAPTAIALYNGETEVTEAIALTPTTNTVTLTPSYTPADATEGVTWASSDETIATVSDGVVTAVSTGMATITATSTIDDNVTATATVNVAFPESEFASTLTIENDNNTRSILTLGANLIKNGSFEYPNPVYGWTTGTGSVNAMSTDNFNVPTEGAFNGNQYLQATTSEGGANEHSINTSWPIEKGKKYVFSFMIKANKQCTTDLQYIGTSLSNTKGQENSNKKLDTPAYGTEWQEIRHIFENDAENGYSWLVFNSRWLGNNQSFDNFYLCEVTDETTTDKVTDEEAAALLAATIPAEGTIPTAVTTNLANLKSALESQKTIAAYNDLTAAISAANALVAPYAAYLVAADDAQIAGVAAATINEQNVAVNQATTVEGINACTTALRTAIADITPFDITDYTIVNPTAQNKDGWEGTDFGGQSNNVCEYWNKSGADFHQTVSLPAGKYCLTAIALQRSDMTGTVYANDKRTIIAQVSNSVVNNRSQASTWFNEGNGVNKVYFELAEASDVTIGLTADASTSDHWTVWKNFQLETFTENVAASFLKPDYDEAMAAAVAYQTVDMFDADKTALNTAITENTVEEASATIAAYETAIANLNAATIAAEKAVAKYTTYNNIVAAIGENTNVDLTEFVTNAGFEEGNLTGWTNGGSIELQAQGNKAYSGHVGDYYAERWHVNGTLDLNQTISCLPAGIYKLTANAYSEFGDGFLYANEAESGFAADGTYSVYINLSDKSSLKIGAKGTLTSSTWFCVDNFTLTYVANDYVYALVDGKMKATVAAAQTDAETAFTENQNGETYQALMNAIAAAQASKDAYATAATAIANAKALKDAHNFATADAITTFADAIAALETPYNEGTLADADAANAGNTLGTLVTGWHAGANTPAVVYMNNGFSLTPDVWEGVYVNTWSTEGESDGSNFKVPFYEYFGGANTMTATLTGLDNGLYSISALVRVETTAEDVADATGITIDVNGGTAVDATAGEQIGESKFKLGTFTAEGLVKDGTLNFNISKLDGSNINWLSFKNIKYTKVRDLLPEESIVVATAEDLVALNDAIAAAEANTLGFDKDEYAPYNNVEALAVLKAAQAIDQTMEYLPQEDVQAATTALTGATWTANEEEVNAVYNGDFAATANNAAPVGWTSTKNGAFSGQYMPRVFNDDDRLSEFNETKSAFFIRFDGTNSDRGTLYYYGNIENYTMPLKANTTYYVKADVKGWGSTGKPQRMNIVGPEGFSGKYHEVTLSDRADNNDAAPQQLLIIFTTTTAGDYKISFQCPGSDDNKHNAVISNIELKRAMITIDEDNTYTPAEMIANVTFNRTFNVREDGAPGWNGAVLPFDMTAEEVKTTFGASDVKDFSGVTVNADGSASLNFEDATEVKAGRPFVMKNTEAGNSYIVNKVFLPATEILPVSQENGNVKYTFTGSFAGTTDLTNVDFALINAGKFYYHTAASGKSSSAKAFRAWFVNESTGGAGARLSFNFGSDVVTSISEVNANGKADFDRMYNLQGQRVMNAKKGLFIQNGKKVVRK